MHRRKKPLSHAIIDFLLDPRSGHSTWQRGEGSSTEAPALTSLMLPCKLLLAVLSSVM